MNDNRRPLSCGHAGNMAFHLHAHRRRAYRPGRYCLICGRNLSRLDETLPEPMRLAVVALHEAAAALGPNARVRMTFPDAG